VEKQEAGSFDGASPPEVPMPTLKSSQIAFILGDACLRARRRGRVQAGAICEDVVDGVFPLIDLVPFWRRLMSKDLRVGRFAEINRSAWCEGCVR
jgi:hypothetical protein